MGMTSEDVFCIQFCGIFLLQRVEGQRINTIWLIQGGLCALYGPAIDLWGKSFDPGFRFAQKL